MNKLIFTTILLLFGFIGFSADKHENHSDHVNGKCGTIQPDINWENAFQIKMVEYLQGRQNGRIMEDSVTIPVIVHVCFYSVTSSSTYNISKAQVDSQFVALNRNFGGRSLFTGGIPAPFRPLLANTKIKWCPATMDQNGNLLAEPGIDRINTRVIGLPNPGSTTRWRRAYVQDTLKPSYYLGSKILL
jgi:hypothetical protein